MNKMISIRKLSRELAGFALFAALSQQAFAGVAVKSYVFERSEVVNLCFMNSNLVTQKLVKDVAATWLQYANITFNYLTTPCRQLGWFDPRKNLVRIYTDKSFSYQSAVGKQVNEIRFPEATMFLKISDKSVKLTSQERSLTLHEFGHVLGLEHEHFHPDIQAQMNESIIRSCEGIGDMTRQECYRNLISPYEPSNMYLTSFDKESIMMYNLSDYSSALEQYKRKTILSAGDIKIIKMLYP